MSAVNSANSHPVWHFLDLDRVVGHYDHGLALAGGRRVSCDYRARHRNEAPPHARRRRLDATAIEMHGQPPCDFSPSVRNPIRPMTSDTTTLGLANERTMKIRYVSSLGGPQPFYLGPVNRA